MEQPRVTTFSAWSCVFVAMVGLWPYGYSIGSINAASVPITHDIRKMYSKRWGVKVDSAFINAIWVTIAVAFPVGGIFGSFLTAPIVRRFGRLKGVVLCHVAFVILAIFLGLSKVFRSPEVMIACRIGIGVFAAAITGICVMYVVEVSPQHMRGKFGMMISLAINVGILLANVLGLLQVLGTEKMWPLFLALVGFPSVAFLLLARTLPESPRELYLEKNDKINATRILRKLNGIQEVGYILAEMDKEKEGFASHPQMTIMQILRSSSLRLSLLVAMMLSASQQLNGLACVAFNMNEILQSAGISADHVYYASIGVYVAVVLMQGVVAVPLIERIGRRPLLIYGYGTQGISLIVLAISLELKYLTGVMAYISIVAAMGFWIGFSFGAGPVTFIVVGELFEQATRCAAVSLSNAVLWLGMTVSALSGPYLLASIRGYTFVIYAIFSFITMAFVIYKCPETKNRSFTNIRRSLNRQRTVESPDYIDMDGLSRAK